VATWTVIRTPIVGFPGWFASLSAGAQALIAGSILVAVLRAFAPPLLAAIAEFVKALK